MLSLRVHASGSEHKPRLVRLWARWLAFGRARGAILRVFASVGSVTFARPETRAERLASAPTGVLLAVLARSARAAGIWSWLR
jgi:hypothetical protein